MYQLHMNTKTPYEIIIKDNIETYINDEIKKVYKNKKIYIITDKRVAAFHLDRVKNALIDFEVESIVIEGNEEAKCFETYIDVCKELVELGCKREELLIALGGGVIGDLVGFVAGTLYRGVPFIQIPTTLLSQVDSSIGGKTGIDFLNHKNIIGVFNQPLAVYIDVNLLKTLPERQLKNGYGEVIKHALIASPKLLNLVKENPLQITEEIIYENLIVKQYKVEHDEFDKGERMKLNFGHTFGHALELRSADMLHGEAVLCGMLMILDFEADLGINTKSLKEELVQVYDLLGLNYKQYDYKELLSDIQFDKKNLAGKLNFIFVDKVGDSYVKVLKGEEYESLN